MNSYERRKELRREKAQASREEAKHSRQMEKASAEQFYSEAFYAHNHYHPRKIPKKSAKALIKLGHVLFSQMHEQELEK